MANQTIQFRIDGVLIDPIVTEDITVRKGGPKYATTVGYNGPKEHYQEDFELPGFECTLARSDWKRIAAKADNRQFDCQVELPNADGTIETHVFTGCRMLEPAQITGKGAMVTFNVNALKREEFNQ